MELAQQRSEALQKGNAFRLRRAAFKREVRAGASLVPALLNPPDYMKSAQTYDVLLYLPKVGDEKATKMLKAAGVSRFGQTLRQLTVRQRGVLADQLRVRED